MANPLMSIFGGNGNLMMQAIGAMMRGENPQAFLQGLANTNPALRGLDLNDINGTAQRLCQERGIDANSLAAEIKTKLPSGRG